MANRKHVRWHRIGAATVAAIALFGVFSSQARSQPTEFRGQVIDQDTGRPITGAIVVGRYTGTRGPEGSTSCNRVESAVADQDGRFTMPIDPRYGWPLMEAYSRGYKWGRSPRWAQNGADGNVDHWQVQVVEWNAENGRAKTVRYEPAIYASRKDAMAASREHMDVYLKPFVGDRTQRLNEIHRLSGAGICEGTYYSSAGPVPFFQAILEEQIELGDDEASLHLVRGVISSAETKHKRSGPKQ
jgi:hypothetical protein